MSKILYVEDHPAQRDIMAQMLELSGYSVAVASDGVEGVDQARAWNPDLILMDLRMPRMDGFEAIKILRSDPSTAGIPIIAIYDQKVGGATWKLWKERHTLAGC